MDNVTSDSVKLRKNNLKMDDENVNDKNNVKGKIKLKPEFANDYVHYIILTPLLGFMLMMGCTRNLCFPWKFDVPLDWGSYFNPVDIAVILTFYSLQAFLSALPVGKLYQIPCRIGVREYRCGAWFNAVVTFAIIGLLHMWGYTVTVFPDKSLSYITTSSIVGLVMSLLLYYKGKNPDYPNPNCLGKPVYDFFMGLEINPRIGNFDIKFSFLEMCTISCLVHNVLLVAKAYSEGDLTPTLLVVCILQMTVAIDFLIFQENFLMSFEVQKESSGYQLIMGYYLWAFLYTSITRYIYYSKVEGSLFTLAITITVFVTGYIIYHGSNTQKHIFRMNPKHPAVADLETIPTSTGKSLLCGGWWGWVRHPNYVGEVLINWSYVIPCGITHWVPLLDPVVITYLVICRTKRDNRRCWDQYGDAWVKYRNKVKYYMIPNVF